jgi:hypothetical protein
MANVMRAFLANFNVGDLTVLGCNEGFVLFIEKGDTAGTVADDGVKEDVAHPPEVLIGGIVHDRHDFELSIVHGRFPRRSLHGTATHSEIR